MPAVGWLFLMRQDLRELEAVVGAPAVGWMVLMGVHLRGLQGVVVAGKGWNPLTCCW